MEQRQGISITGNKVNPEIDTWVLFKDRRGGKFKLYNSMHNSIVSCLLFNGRLYHSQIALGQRGGGGGGGGGGTIGV